MIAPSIDRDKRNSGSIAVGVVVDRGDGGDGEGDGGYDGHDVGDDGDDDWYFA